MTDTLTRAPAVITDTRTSEPDLDDRPEHAHIVKTEPGENAAALVFEARVNGTPVTALCGVRFIPQQDPSKLPRCKDCLDIYEMYRAFSDGGMNRDEPET